MTRTDKDRIEGILKCIEKMEGYVEGRTDDDLSKDERTKDAVKWNLENISEEVTNVSEETKDKYEDVEWDKITSIRIKYVHKYWELNFEVVRETIDNITRQKEDFERILEREKSE